MPAASARHGAEIILLKRGTTMRRTGIVMITLLFWIAVAQQVSAVEHRFGGYWRTRAFSQRNFSGESNSEKDDLSRADTRTRLYYTARFDQKFKFVNEFEMDAIWGDQSAGYGDIKSDGVSMEVRQSYVDFDTAGTNWRIGVQDYKLARGFLFNENGAGAHVTYRDESYELPFYWIKGYEGGEGKDSNDADVDYYGFYPSFFTERLTIRPGVLWVTTDNADPWDKDLSGFEEWRSYYLSLELEAHIDPVDCWLTGIYQIGEAATTSGIDKDINAYLLAAGGRMKTGFGRIHAQIFYATGDADADDTIEAFDPPYGNMYYWSEIMGLGIFDNQYSANSPNDNISNIIAANIGVKYKINSKWSLKADLWRAKLAEENQEGEGLLGTEVDLVATYKIFKNLKLEIVGAYLFAGGATYSGEDEADPYELGTRLSFRF